MKLESEANEPHPARGSALEVLQAFLKLGLTSFGGPVAHLAYFRTEFVERRRWLDDASYSDLVALCQFLPGPASSQVGIALGLRRAGWLGGLLAWAAFTAPSALALILFALSVARWDTLARSGAMHGLKIAAVAIVAQAVWGMWKSLCPDRQRGAIAVCAVLLVIALPATTGQMIAMAVGGIVGAWVVPASPARPATSHDYGVTRRAGALLLATAALLLLALPAAAAATGWLTLQAVAAIYKAGALVFGGGHVVLPLLQASVVRAGWLSNSSFLAGYGAAQAVPGPLFSFAAYLGAAMSIGPGGWAGGLLMVVTIFLPGALLVTGALPYWESLRRHAWIRRAMAGVNAAVVGVLAAALYDPVWTSTIHLLNDAVLAFAAFGLLMFARMSPLWVVLLATLGGWAATPA